jgi:chromosome segregation ATPase
LEEDKRSLENEKARIPNRHEIDEKAKSLRHECDDLRRQIAQKKAEIKDQNMSLADKRKKFGLATKNYEELMVTIDTLEVIVCCFA